MTRPPTSTEMRSGLPSASRGIVGDTVFGVLPDVRPAACFALALVGTAVYAARLWQRPTYRALVLCVSLCALTSFAVGWHVHEKAILLAVVPLSLVTSYSYAYFRAWELLSAITIVSLFLLLHRPLETPVKLAYSALWFFVVAHALRRRILRPMSSNVGVIVHFLESKYLQGLAVLAVVTNVAPDHLGMRGIDTLEQLADVKAVIVEAVPRDGFAVLNADDPLVAAMASRSHARVQTVGLSEGADLRATERKVEAVWGAIPPAGRCGVLVAEAAA